MIWATRNVHRDDLRSIKLLFREQVEALDPGRQMLLVGIHADWQITQAWVGVVEYDLLTPYIGFTHCTRNKLPTAPILIAGNLKRFGEVFHTR